MGGRLGYVLFYNFDYYLDNFFDIFKIWHGGMSFHGGGDWNNYLQAVLFSKKNNDNIFKYLDIIAIVSPIGIFFGRIANFINSELYGLRKHQFHGQFNLFKLIIYIVTLHNYMRLY